MDDAFEIIVDLAQVFFKGGWKGFLAWLVIGGGILFGAAVYTGFIVL